MAGDANDNNVHFEVHLLYVHDEYEICTSNNLHNRYLPKTFSMLKLETTIKQNVTLDFYVLQHCMITTTPIYYTYFSFYPGT